MIWPQSLKHLETSIWAIHTWLDQYWQFAQWQTNRKPKPNFQGDIGPKLGVQPRHHWYWSKMRFQSMLHTCPKASCDLWSLKTSFQQCFLIIKWMTKLFFSFLTFLFWYFSYEIVIWCSWLEIKIDIRDNDVIITFDSDTLEIILILYLLNSFALMFLDVYDLREIRNLTIVYLSQLVHNPIWNRENFIEHRSWKHFKILKDK